MMDTPLCNALGEVIQQNRVRMHVPFHAGRALVWGPFSTWDAALDLTELPSLDVLGHPTGVLKESQTGVAQLYGARESFYLVNGASVGLMAAMLACGLGDRDTVLIARNAHRSVVHGLVLCGAQPQWVLPTPHADWGVWGELTVEAVEAALKNAPQKPKALILTHPTYDGLPSDIAALSACCLRHGMLLIVDEAHGALWPLFDFLPPSAVTQGADVVIHSLHKSGGCLTQGALLHLPHGSQISAPSVQETLNLLQTTSPSYPLLANMESTLAYWGSSAGYEALKVWIGSIQSLRSWIGQSLQNIQRFDAFDSLNETGFQLLLRHSALSGEDFATRLEEAYDLAFESFTPQSVLLNLNAGLDIEALSRLKTALLNLDKVLGNPRSQAMNFLLPKMTMTPRQAWFSVGEVIPAEKAVGRISRQVVAACPPGIPVLMPGEIIQAAQLPFLPQHVMVI